MSPPRGFTLVEMLVALAVFAVLATAGVVVLANAADHQALVDARLDRLLELQRARAVLATDLSQATPRRVRGTDGRAMRDAFAGARLQGAVDHGVPILAFVRTGWTNPDGLDRASLQYVEYRVAGGRLERSTRDALDGVAARSPQVLLAGIASARLAYRDHGTWSDGWPGGATRLPGAVRLDLSLDGIGEVRQVFLLPEPPR